MRDDGVVLGEFVGAYFAAERGSGPAVMLLGGSEGGWPTHGVTLARRLAENGVPALALASFGLPGLPAHLQAIPLEYFADAMTWLANEQGGLEPTQVVVLGISRGSEAAQLLAVHSPHLVHHVVAIVPSNLVMGAWPPPAHGAAWTVDGAPIPYASRFGPDPEGNASAVIPVERIAGRMLVVGAGSDAVWPSAAMTEAIAARRVEHGHADDVVIVHAHAGHRFASTTDENDGPDQRASRALWNSLLDFLATLGD